VTRLVASEGAAGIVGREPELRVLGEFLAATDGSRALLLKGGPGVGNTTLWQAGRETALARGMRVLAARPASEETSLSFAGTCRGRTPSWACAHVRSSREW